MNILDQFLEVINNYSETKLNKTNIENNLTLIEDLKMDSLLLVSFFSELEDQFNVNFDFLDFDEINNITFLYHYIIKVKNYEEPK